MDYYKTKIIHNMKYYLCKTCSFNEQLTRQEVNFSFQVKWQYLQAKITQKLLLVHLFCLHI